MESATTTTGKVTGGEGCSMEEDVASARSKPTYTDSLAGEQKNRQLKEFVWEDWEISDDDMLEESVDEALFSMGMSREEKMEARVP